SLRLYTAGVPAAASLRDWAGSALRGWQARPEPAAPAAAAARPAPGFDYPELRDAVAAPAASYAGPGAVSADTEAFAFMQAAGEAAPGGEAASSYSLSGSPGSRLGPGAGRAGAALAAAPFLSLLGLGLILRSRLFA
ncbi:MAG: hypothetical protein PHF00_13355, partial [Elusimicrobia bacterium]|nr:hypothetical protein [Elusimicrobiota bacterium]